MLKFIEITLIKLTAAIIDLNKTLADRIANDLKVQINESQYDFFVTGGKGKSLTRTLLKEILQPELQKEIISNNQTTDSYEGVITEFIKSTNLRGELNTNNFIVEVDAASLSNLAKLFKPSTIIINSLSEKAEIEFDQIIQGIKSSLRLKLRNYIVYNIDDPRLQKLPELFGNYHSFYSYGAKDKRNPDINPEFYFDILNEEVDLNIINIGDDDKRLEVKLPGQSNLYDIAAAAAAAYWSGISLEEIKQVLENSQDLKITSP
jgi:UDP-N-acetylmuramyl pentapeptide synthase